MPRKRIRAPALTEQFLTPEILSMFHRPLESKDLVLHKCMFCESYYNIHKNKSLDCSHRCWSMLNKTGAYYDK